MVDVLIREDVRISEANVDEDPICAGDGRDDAIENLAMRLVFVEAETHEIAQIAARL